MAASRILLHDISLPFFEVYAIKELIAKDLACEFSLKQ